MRNPCMVIYERQGSPVTRPPQSSSGQGIGMAQNKNGRSYCCLPFKFWLFPFSDSQSGRISVLLVFSPNSLFHTLQLQCVAQTRDWIKFGTRNLGCNQKISLKLWILGCWLLPILKYSICMHLYFKVLLTDNNNGKHSLKLSWPHCSPSIRLSWVPKSRENQTHMRDWMHSQRPQGSILVLNQMKRFLLSFEDRRWSWTISLNSLLNCLNGVLNH